VCTFANQVERVPKAMPLTLILQYNSSIQLVMSGQVDLWTPTLPFKTSHFKVTTTAAAAAA